MRLRKSNSMLVDSSQKKKSPHHPNHPFIFNTTVQVLILAAFLVLYVLTNNRIFGIGGILFLLFMVFYESYVGIKQHGVINEIKEILITVLVVVVVWGMLVVVLGTDTPLSGIASCSMKPNLNRGDLIVLYNNPSDPPKAPVVNIPDHETATIGYEAIVNGMHINGSIWYYCSANPDTKICKNFVNNPEAFKERHGAVTFNYGVCEIKNNGKMFKTPCVVSLSVSGKTYSIRSKGRDVIAYTPKPSDVFSRLGDISHRVQLVIKTEKSMYFLTKGDNNNVFDIQMYDYASKSGNSLVDYSQLKGKVIFVIPYLGYFKLFLSGLYSVPSQCYWTLITPGFYD